MKRLYVRSAERIPPILLHETGTTEIDQNAFPCRPQDDVLVFDISVHYQSVKYQPVYSLKWTEPTNPLRMQECHGIRDLP